MNLLSAEKLSKSFTEKPLLDQISFGLAEGDRIGLVGHNGSGKSTLLRILAGIITPDSGKLAFRQNLRIGYLPQEPEFDPALKVADAVFDPENPLSKLLKDYSQALQHPKQTGLAELTEQMEQSGAWDLEQRSQQILGKLGIVRTDQLCASLSGGQIKRLALARMLLSAPDLMILDESTNHLDLETIEWLENMLQGHGTTLIMVTHDRYFLDQVATQIWELDHGKLYRHGNRYADYLENRAAREANRTTELARLNNLLRKEQVWMSKMPKARGTKSKSRIQAFHELKEQTRDHKIKKNIEIETGMSRLGNRVAEVKHLSKSYGEIQLLKDFSYLFHKKDRIGIIGKNGSGKSTFLNILCGMEQPDSGTVEYGPTLKTGYYTQHSDDLNPENRIIDEIKNIAEFLDLGNGEKISASALLDRFLFPPSVQHTPVAKLSGGERRRLQLLKVLITAPNFLILDEPTNDLDIDTLNVLEEFLENFEGCLLLVSHDRYFMDRLTEHLFIFGDNGSIRDYYGNYTDYRTDREEEEKNRQTVRQSVMPDAANTETPARKKRSFKEQREMEQLEKEIPELQARKDELQQMLSGQCTDPAQIAEYSKELLRISDRLDESELRWLELSET